MKIQNNIIFNVLCDFLALEKPRFWHDDGRYPPPEIKMGKPPMRDRTSLAERLKTRAASLQPDKSATTISKIIEVRGVLAEQRLRGLSWAALTDLLESEGVSLAEGTLRNYMRMIALAEANLKGEGNPVPTDAEIHAALHLRQGTHAAQTLTSAPRQKLSAPSIHGEGQKIPVRPHSPPSLPPVGFSIIRSPDRDL